MAEWEKVIEGLERLREYANNEVHPVVSPDNWSIYCGLMDLIDEIEEDTLALLKAQEPIEARLHLCESCTKLYPECDATADGIEFGCGVGNDNVIGCMAYVNRWKAQEPRVMTLEELKADDQRDYEAAVEMTEYCERYEPTYNPEDGSM